MVHSCTEQPLHGTEVDANAQPEATSYQGKYAKERKGLEHKNVLASIPARLKSEPAHVNLMKC